MRPVFLFAKQMYILIQRIINISVLDKLLSGFMEKKNGEVLSLVLQQENIIFYSAIRQGI